MPPKKKAFRLRRQRMQEYTNEVDSETGLSRAKLASLKAHAPKDVRDVADSLVNLSSDTLSRERRTAVFETEDKWRRVRRTLEGEDGNPIISAYRLEQLKKLEIQIKHNDPNGQKKLGQLSRLGDSLALATRDIAATRYSAKDKVRTAERRLEALNLDYQKLANNHKDLQAKFAKLESKKGLTAELKKVNAKLQRSHTAVQSLKGRLRHPESFLTSELVKNFIDRRLRPTAVKWSLSVMVESSKLRKYGVSANVLPKVCIRGDGSVWDNRFEDFEYDPETFDITELMGFHGPYSRYSRCTPMEVENPLEPIPVFVGPFADILRTAWVVLEPADFNELIDGITVGCKVALERHIKWYAEWQRLPHSVGRILLAESVGPAYARAFLFTFFREETNKHLLESEGRRGYVPTLQQLIFEFYLKADVASAGPQGPNTFKLKELMAVSRSLFLEVIRYGFPQSPEDMVVGPLLEKWACLYIFPLYVLTQQIEGDFNRIDNVSQKNMTVRSINSVMVGCGVNSVDVNMGAGDLTAARAAARQHREEAKFKGQAEELRDVQKHLAAVEERKRKAADLARQREAAEVAREVRQVCAKCFETHKRLIST
eukprot:gene25090-30616_t